MRWDPLLSVIKNRPCCIVLPPGCVGLVDMGTGTIPTFGNPPTAVGASLMSPESLVRFVKVISIKTESAAWLPPCANACWVVPAMPSTTNAVIATSSFFIF